MTHVFSPVHLPEDVAIRAYIAGLIDGEGTIFMKGETPKHYPSFTVHIYNTNRDIIDWLSQFGGSVYWATKPDRPQSKPCARWGVQDFKGCWVLLKAVYPYLIIKKARAREVMDRLWERYGISGVLPM